MEEIWKTCTRNAQYEVSNMGKIRNSKKKVLERKPDCAGYIRAYLGYKKCVALHILVAEAFIPKLDLSKTLVNHIDGIRHNNNVLNLEWVTSKENANKKVFPCLKPKRPIMEDLPGEIWTDFTFMKFNIKVSNLGRICLPSGNKTYGSPGRDKYMRINLIKGKSCVMVHRIICTACHGEPPTDKHVVNHKDCNRQNNKPENLEWVTQRQNIIHAKALQPFTPAHNKRKVCQFTIEGEYLDTFESVTDAALKTKSNRSRIQQFLNPNNKSAHACGFKWKYE